MKTKLSLVALLAATCLTAPALAADLAVKARPVVAPVPFADWSGVYVGLEAGYGWGRDSFDQFNSPGGFGGAGNIADILTGQSNILFPAFTGVGPFSRINTQGWMAGGFVGAQKQWGNWVFGIEADFDAADIHGSFSGSRVSEGTVSLFDMARAQVNSVTIPGQNRTGTGTATVAPVIVTSTGSLTIPGQTITSTGTVTVRPSVVDITGIAHPCQTAACPAGQGGVPNTFAPGTVIPAGTTIFIGNTVAEQALTQTGAAAGTVAGNNIGQPVANEGNSFPSDGLRNNQGVIGVRTTVPLTVGAGGIVTVALPGFTVPGQTDAVSVTGRTTAVTLPVSVTGTVPGQVAPVVVTTNLNGVASTGFTTNPVLQRLDVVGVDITRRLSVDTKIDEIGSVRGKVGFVPAQDWLLYATGGLAWAHGTKNITATESFALDFGDGPQTFSHTARSSGGGTLLGWALGAGFDWKKPIDQGSSLVLGIEYLHYEFPKNTISLSDGSSSASFVSNRQSVDSVKGRISYLFAIH